MPKILPNATRIAVDTETTGLSTWHGDRPYAFSFCDDQGRTEFRRLPVDPKTRQVKVINAPQMAVYEELREVFSRDTIKQYIFFNAKFDVRMCDAFGVLDPQKLRIRAHVDDAMFLAHCCNSLEPSFGLKPLAQRYCQVAVDDEDDLRRDTMAARRAAKLRGEPVADGVPADYWRASPALLEKYARRDAERTMLLWLVLADRAKDLNVVDAYDRERRLFWITYDMETRGVRIDLDVVRTEIAKHETGLAGSQKELASAAPGVNARSAAQLRKLFYEDGGVEVHHRTPKGAPSVDTKAIQHLEHPAAQALAKYRSHEKALSSFFYRYRDLAVRDPLGDLGARCLHPDFQQVGPVTGRYSCRNPNLQNVANALTTRSSEPIQARMPFGPRPGCVWYHFDYDQLEVRIFAAVSGEQFMMDALNSGRDLHTECANKAWGGRGNPLAVEAARHALELDGSGGGASITVDQARKACDFDAVRWLDGFDWDIVAAEKSLDKKTTRAKAKMLLFLKVFGGGPAAAADLMDVPVSAAIQFLREYDAAFPRIGQFLQEMSTLARKQGFIRNLWDRRLAVDPDAAYRSVNYMVQGSAADLLKDRMIAVDALLRKFRERKRMGAWMVLTIHDELVLEVERRAATRPFLRWVQRTMQDHGGRIAVPTPVTVSKTRVRWNEPQKISL